MKVKIYRGTHEIGGTCIEITADNGKRLWVDIGQPLSEENPDTGYAEHTPDAVLISHPHRDHFGLLSKIPRNVPVYAGEITYSLMNATNIFINEKQFDNDVHYFKAWEQFDILDTFKVFPYLTDHSSAEAYAFLIECDGKKIFYSGDFRNGGAKKIVFENLCSKPPKGTDVMFVEGTTIDRDKAEYPDESAVEMKLAELFKSQKNSSFVVGSGQNVDRIVTLYRACKRTGKTLIIDPYIAYILDIVGKASKNLPQADWQYIKVYNNSAHISKLEKLGKTELIEKCKNTLWCR